ncbi:MAG TPA: hypothetical protein PKA00_21645 [Saprospiraceae bacterium]|nr:hypothetical protein [Ignavibacteria bacterium]HMQ85530.1 hypothetical protein [Saprospiraceae bacterium]
MDFIKGDKIKGDKVLGDKNIILRLPSWLLWVISILIVFISIYFLFFHKTPHFRTLYFEVNGQGIDFMLENKIEPDWISKLGGKAYLCENNVLGNAKKLRSMYNIASIKIDDEVDMGYVNELYYDFHLDNNQIDSIQKIRINKAHNTSEAIDKRQNEISKYLICTSGNEYITRSVSREDAALSMKTLPECSKYVTNVKRVKHSDSSIVCTRFASLTEVNDFYWRSIDDDDTEEYFHKIDNQLIDFLNEISPNWIPTDLIPYTIYPTYFDSSIHIPTQRADVGDIVTGFDKEIEFPVLKMKVIVIENLEDKPIRIESIKYSEIFNNAKPKLRTLLLNNKLLDESEIKNISGDIFFPPIYLMPSEKIIVPNYLYLETSGNKKYIFGPSFKIHQIKISGENFTFREERSTEFKLYLEGLGTGSCPYAFTKNYKKKGDSLINQGAFLVGQERSQYNYLDTIRISNFDDGIYIAELEKELSFIDYVTILEKKKSGKTVLYACEIPELQNIDGKFCTLFPGNLFKIPFNIPHESPTSTYYLISKGYYRPFKYKRR